MTLYYVCDGSFEGLLTAIYESYYRHEAPEEILMDIPAQQHLFIEYRPIDTDTVKAQKVYHSIEAKISQQALLHVRNVYLSDSKDTGTWIYQYLRMGWKLGQRVDDYLTDERVLRIHKISRKVGWESHRMLGLLRFQKLANDIYYGALEPDHNIVSLIAPHFAHRMADQNWIIHDLKREVAALYNQKEWVLTSLQTLPDLTIEEKEALYQELWKTYFHSISIKSRTNPKLQRQHMPIRYWDHLTEK